MSPIVLREVIYSASVLEVLHKNGDDLRKKPWRGDPNPLSGHCYVASEALYHMLGGKENGLKAYTVHHEGTIHWFLKKGSQVIDITAGQFKTRVPYEEGRGRGFLTREPSKRARILMERAGYKQLPLLSPFNKRGI